MIIWEVSGKYGKRKRTITVDATDFQSAKRDALHIIDSWYSSHSGTYGNEVWSKGVITMQTHNVPPTIIRDPNNPDADLSAPEERADIISLNDWR